MKKSLLLWAVGCCALFATGALAEEAAPNAEAAPAAEKPAAEKPAKKMKKKHHKAAEHKAMHHRHHRVSEVEDLRKQVAELMVRLEQMERRPNLTEKEAITDGTPLKLKITGQVNKAALWHDNGRNSHVQIVDNDASATKVDFMAEGAWNEDVTVFGHINVELPQNSTKNTDVRNSASEINHANTGHSFETQSAEVGVKSKQFGNFYLGRGSTASDYTMEATDKSGTTVTSIGASVADIAAGTRWIEKTTGLPKKVLTRGNTLLPTVGDVFNSADGNDERDRFMYETPTYMGFHLAGSYAYNGGADGTSDAFRNGGNELWDVALKYAGEYKGTEIAGQVAYSKDHTVAIRTSSAVEHRTDASTVDGSISVLFPVGISLMFAGAHRDWEFANAHDATVLFGKLGYRHKFFEAGFTNFAVDYGEYKNFVIDATSTASVQNKWKGKAVGAMLVQDFDRIATKMYVAWRLYQLHVSGGAKYKDITAVIAGMSVKF